MCSQALLSLALPVMEWRLARGRPKDKDDRHELMEIHEDLHQYHVTPSDGNRHTKKGGDDPSSMQNDGEAPGQQKHLAGSDNSFLWWVLRGHASEHPGEVAGISQVLDEAVDVCRGILIASGESQRSWLLTACNGELALPLIASPSPHWPSMWMPQRMMACPRISVQQLLSTSHD